MDSDVRTPIPWKRYWVEQSAASLVETENGFLKLPSEIRRRYERNKAAPLNHLPELSDVSCLVLLGGSGLGKSYELRAISSPDIQSSPTCYIDLRGRSDSSSIEKALHGKSEFLGWLENQHGLTLVLDSLDECQRRVPEVGAIICDILRPQIAKRLRLLLRLGCRASEWDTKANESLKALFPFPTDRTATVRTFYLERLTRDQVAEAARHRGVNDVSFLAQVDHSQLGALASHPVTLDLLLAERSAGRPLGDTRTSIYEQGLRSLCEDRHQRPSHLPHNSTTPEQRFSLAARSAAIGVLTDRYSFALSSERAPSSLETTLTPDDLIGTALPDAPIHANTRTLRETCFSGLFTHLAENAVTWTHRSYAEFLAAYHLHQSIPLDELIGVFCDTTTSTPRLYPQLEEVAAWLAELNPAFFDRLADANAETFLRCDPHLLNPSVRERLTAAYLRRIGQDDAQVPGWFNKLPVEKLAHSKLAGQLRVIIFDSGQPELLRLSALRIAEACSLGELAPDCIPLLFAADTSANFISVIGNLLQATATSAICASLRTQLFATASPREESLARSIGVLWPEHLSAEELIHLLPPPTQWDEHGSLRHIASSHIPRHARPEQLPVLLNWVRNQGDALDDRRNYWGGLAKQNIALKGFRNLQTPAVRAAFLALLEAQTHSSGRLLPSFSRDDRDETAETPLRRLLCQAVIEEYPHLFTNTFSWMIMDCGWHCSRDLQWALEQLRMAPGQGVRERWLSYVCWIFDKADRWASIMIVESVLGNATEATTILEQCAASPLMPYGYPNPEKRRHYERIAKDERRAESPSFEATITHAFSAHEAGDLNAMAWLLANLHRHRPNPPPNGPAPRRAPLDGWSEISADLAERIRATYPRYLEQITALDLLITKEGEETGHTLHGLRCLLHTATQASDWFDSRPADFWRVWQRPLLSGLASLGAQGADREHTALIRRLYKSAPTDFTAALDESLHRHGASFFDPQLIDAPEITGDAGVRTVLLKHASRSETHSSLAHELWTILMRENWPDADAWLLAAIKRPEPSAFAAAVLLVHRSASHGTSIAHAMLASQNWLRAVCLALPGNGFDVRWDWGLRLPPDLTLQIWEAMAAISAADPFTNKMTPETSLYHLRGNLLNSFGGNPSPERCAAVHSLQFRRASDSGWLGQMLVRMRKQLRAAARTNYSPRQARDYLDIKSKPRPILNEGDLCARILEILSEFQKLLRDVPNPSAELWNTPAGPSDHWYPRSEVDISDRLQYHLNVAFGPLGGSAMREPETRRGQTSAGDPTDLPDLVVSLPGKDRILRVVIEVKCTWHQDAISALRTQLAERYLREFQCGIYCLLHFTCPTWDHPNDKRMQRGKARAKLSDIEQEILILRDTLQKTQPERRIDAVVINAARTPPGGRHLSSNHSSKPPKRNLRRTKR